MRGKATKGGEGGDNSFGGCKRGGGGGLFVVEMDK